MREFKFRAWSNKYRRMFRVSEISMDRDGYTHGLVDAGFENEHRPENEEFKSPLAWIGRVDFVKSPTGRVSGLSQDPMDEPFNLMQSTGLKDKNSKEIYAGDIICYNEGKTESRAKMTVEWKGTGFALSAYKEDWVYDLGECISNALEVIGNIYEHSHLLEGTT